MIDNDYYFVHSFALKINNGSNIKVANTKYEGSSIVAALKKDNIFATQFHPEKSGLNGVSILKKYR